MYSVTNITLVFSYWLFAWYILYEAKMTTYNPQFALVCGLLENLAMLVAMMYYRNKPIHIVAFIFINSCIKLFPLWRLRHTRFTEDDIGITCILFLVYCIWLRMNNLGVETIAQNGMDNILHNKPPGPFSAFVVNMLTQTKN